MGAADVTPITKHRRFRLHLMGPRPHGSTYHTCGGDPAIGRLLADGWRLYRVSEIPRRYWAAEPSPPATSEI